MFCKTPRALLPRKYEEPIIKTKALSLRRWEGQVLLLRRSCWMIIILKRSRPKMLQRPNLLQHRRLLRLYPPNHLLIQAHPYPRPLLPTPLQRWNRQVRQTVLFQRVERRRQLLRREAVIRPSPLIRLSQPAHPRPPILPFLPIPLSPPTSLHPPTHPLPPIFPYPQIPLSR